MQILRAFVILCIIAVLAIAVLFTDFAYKTFSYRQKSVNADAIVVLTGGKGRVAEGVRLFKERRGEYLFLVGVDPSVKKSDIYIPRPGDPSADRLFLEKTSRNTIENSIYARGLINSHDVRKIILITSRYHLKRASLLFRNSLYRDVTIIPYPVDTVNLKESWWKHGGSFQLLFSEFYKYCLLRVFFLMAPGELRDSVMPQAL